MAKVAGYNFSRTCRKRFWEADFQATPTDWATASEYLRRRRAIREPCICSTDERMAADILDPGSGLLFSDRLQTTVLHHPEDQLLSQRGVRERQPDRIFGLEHTRVLKQLLPDPEVLRHSPFKDGHLSYPFLIIEAKSEKGSPGFQSVERQSAFPIRTLLKLQLDLQTVRNVPISPLVWFMANQGDEWRVYACIVDGAKYRIIDIWHGCMLSLDSTLQLLLIADYICDWARDIFRPNILRCLSGRDDILRDETPASAYRDSFDFTNMALSTSQPDDSTARNLNSITRRTHSLSLDPSLGSILTNPYSLPYEESDGSSDKALCEGDYRCLQFSQAEGNPVPWKQHATIRHSNLILFSFHILSIPEDPSQIIKILESLSRSEPGPPTTCEDLLELLDDDQSITVTMNAVYQLETAWTGRAHKPTALGDFPVRARVLFHTYLREDWQIIREIHCIAASRFAVLALMQMAGHHGRPSYLSPGLMPSITLETENLRALRCFSGSASLAGALSAAYLRLATEPSPSPAGTNPPSVVFQPLNENENSPLFDLEKKLTYKQTSNPTSSKQETVSDGFAAPAELKRCSVPTRKMDRTGAVLIKKPLSWSADSPAFCLMILDDVPLTDLPRLGQRLSEVCAAQNIYVTGAERGNDGHPLSDVDQIGILRWIEILSGRLSEDSPWEM
ncbi:hypothetical protein ASPWEDRAFT_42963 [Aspergillus wentii DTO 134E9]|uniref:Uncharacterized protein n=1 Tax=Aspergillus wentii DTO 134E9 TaxID=1073089 RepID=A0A1L9RDD4_ASPWE|nr:uncharacterized protein ASPWEDRAFT_42963 [Aspergillus wentii DTO 134E9]OJJ32935.1 hypothetical protein ASPWEDRAFT_42963 [Aspergillus wentii DTO 134E9]